MAIEVNVISKCEVAGSIEVEVSYTCPHCSESVTETICFSNTIKNCIADVSGQECPECGEENDLEVDLY